ncbi:hypothetical protein O6H91_01G059500 [Diphasiastrum complanatum]|nr:hypothetical protein O6H91_01G059500 [Diphasiastrum complanatum]
MIVVIVLGSTGMFMGLVSLILGLLICCLGHEWCFSSCGRLCGCLKRCKVHHSEQTETHVPSSAIVGSSASRRSRIRSIRSLGHAESFSFSELSLATDGFSDEKKIGAGSFGIVYHGYLSDGREVAIKRGETRPNAKKFQEKEVAFQSEIEFLGRLHHRHLVSLVGFCAEDEERLLVYDYMPNGTLYDHVHEFGSKQQQQQKPSPFQSWQMRTKVALQAAKGIEYLHNYAVPPIIHRDIKSSNILLDATWAARVSDFGLSLMGPLDEESHLSLTAAGTVGYMDPAYYRLQQLTPKSDVYSYGVVLLELITGKRAIFKSNQGPVSLVDFAVPILLADELHTILDPNADPPQPMEIEAIALLAEMGEQCVRLEGKERPSMTEVVSRLEQISGLFGTSQKLKARTDSSETETG